MDISAVSQNDVKPNVRYVSHERTAGVIAVYGGSESDGNQGFDGVLSSFQAQDRVPPGGIRQRRSSVRASHPGRNPQSAILHSA